MSFPRFVSFIWHIHIPGYYRFLLVLVPMGAPYRTTQSKALLGYGWDVDRAQVVRCATRTH